MARHKKSKKHSRRRRHRGGFWSINPMNWGKPAPVAAQTLELPPAKMAQAAAPVVDSTVGTPSQQAAAVGAPAGSASILGPTASTAAAMGGRRRTRRRKTRRRH
jgi:hypothetical protein